MNRAVKECRTDGGVLADAGSTPAASTNKTNKPPSWRLFCYYGTGVTNLRSGFTTLRK